MSKRMIITIKRRSQPEWLVWTLIVFPFLFALMDDVLGLPWAIRYVLDATWFAALLMILLFRGQLPMKTMRGICGWTMLFMLYTASVYLVEFQSPLYYLWGFRNNFRFYFACLIFALFLTSKDIEDYLKLFDKLFWINFVISLVQFYIMGFSGDNLGGLFGTKAGVNGYTYLFFTIIVTKSLLMYLQKRDNSWSCASKCVAALGVSAMAELKFFFVECALILALAVLFTEFTWRKLWVILGGTVAIAGCVALLVVLFPSFRGFFSLEWLYNTATSNKGYTYDGDLNRLNAIPQINTLWLENWSQRLFGLGLGNCDTSGFAFVNTPFYKQNSDMHYSWISYAFMYLECGWIGLLFYFGFFVMVFLKADKTSKRVQGNGKVFCLLAKIFAICCIITSVYNGSLRTEAGYMAYFVLAIPYVIEKEYKTQKRRAHLAEKLAAQNSVQGEGVI